VKNLVNPKNQLKNHSGSTTKDAKKNLVCKSRVPLRLLCTKSRRRNSSFSEMKWFENGSGKEETREEEL
jgi:hypothetical protein